MTISAVVSVIVYLFTVAIGFAGHSAYAEWTRMRCIHNSEPSYAKDPSFAVWIWWPFVLFGWFWFKAWQLSYWLVERAYKGVAHIFGVWPRQLVRSKFERRRARLLLQALQEGLDKKTADEARIEGAERGPHR